MKASIDISPLKSGHNLLHRVRGTGFYIENLKKALLKYYPEHQYNFYSQSEKIPKDTNIVHIPYFEPFFLTLPFIKKFKTVVTVHDLTPLVFPKYFPSGIKGKIKWELQKLALKKADAIIADSECSRKDIIKYAGISAEKVKVIYLAVAEKFKKMEDGKWKMEMIKKYKLPEKFVLYVGDATWNKNLLRLIKAVSKINIPLVIVGKALVSEDIDAENPWNSDLVEVQRIAKENKNIFRLGFVPSEDLVELYNAAKLFVMPSIYEGFGLPVLEAMKCGCPVVASKGGSLAEVVGDAGRFIDPYDVDSIATGIREVFEDTNLGRNLSKKGAVQSSKFTWEKTAKKTMEVYKSV